MGDFGRSAKTSIMDMGKDTKEPVQSVQVFGRKKTATAVAYCKRGKGLVRVNGKPLEQVEPKPLQFKLQEPLLLLGKDRFSEVDIRIRVKGGGRVSQIYAIRQALSKAIVAYYQKYVDEQSKKTIKDILIQFDRNLLVADPHRCKAKMKAVAFLLLLTFGTSAAVSCWRFDGKTWSKFDQQGAVCTYKLNKDGSIRLAGKSWNKGNTELHNWETCDTDFCNKDVAA